MIRLVLTSGGRIFVQLLLIPVLARLIAPEAFGLIAMAMPVLIFTSIMAEAGLVTGLVRTRIDLEAESSAFWFSTAVGTAGAALIAALALPLAWMSGQPKLAPVLWTLAPVLLLSGMTAAPSARLQRHGDFAAFGRVELIAAAAGAGVALSAAMAGWGLYSLAVQQVALSLARLIGSLAASRFRPLASFEMRRIRAILSLSSPMLGANLLTYLSRSLDNLLIGLFVGARPLGFYSTAYQVIQIPEYVLGASARTVALPAIAQASSPEERTAAYFRSLSLVVAIGAPIAIGCSLESAPLVRLVLGPNWAPVAPLAALMAPLGLVWSCFQLNSAALAALEDNHGQIRSSMFTSVMGIAGILAGMHWGVRGVAIGYVTASSLSVIPNFFYVLRALQVSVRQIVEAFAYPLASGAVMVAAVKFWQAGPGAPTAPFPEIVGAGVLGLAAYALAWLTFEVLLMA